MRYGRTLRWGVLVSLLFALVAVGNLPSAFGQGGYVSVPPDEAADPIPVDDPTSEAGFEQILNALDAPPGVFVALSSCLDAANADGVLTKGEAADCINAGTTIPQGGVGFVGGAGFEGGATVTGTIASNPISLGTVTADAAGNAAFDFRLPANFPAGAHTITLRGTGADGEPLVLSLGITVTGKVSPKTGVGIPLGGALGLLALAAVGMVVLLRTKRGGERGQPH